MKQFSAILNIVLLIAVAVLFYLHFQGSSPAPVRKVAATNSSGQLAPTVVYFDLDTLENQYTYFKETRNYLQRQDDVLNQRLAGLRNAFKKEMMSAQQKGQSMSQTEQMEVQQKLMQLEQNYKTAEVDGNRNLQAVTMQKMQDVKRRIQAFLNTFCAERNYQYVFATSENDYIYYKDSAQNITRELVEALNSQYKDEKKKK